MQNNSYGINEELGWVALMCEQGKLGRGTCLAWGGAEGRTGCPAWKTLVLS